MKEPQHFIGQPCGYCLDRKGKGASRLAPSPCPVCRGVALPGMEIHVEAQEQAAAVYSGEELTAKLLEPKADISRKAGEIERNSPLFFGTGANPSLW